jgi:alcohol dehydrogenase class IV
MSLSGPGCLYQFMKQLRDRGFKKCMLVAGGHFLESQAAVLLIKELGDKIALVIKTPTGLLDKQHLAAFSIPPDLDAIIAVGGGRTIDFAKAIICFNEINNALFIAVPTTAGSGSEATSFAVLYENGLKYSIERPDLLPGETVLDAELLGSQNPTQRAITGLDALAQCIESTWSLRADTSSRKIAKPAMDWLWNNLPTVVKSGDYKVLQDALYAANKSGQAIQLTRTTGAHALSYYLSSRHGIEHGHAVALTMAVFLQYNAEVYTSLEEYSPLHLFGVTDGAEAAARWKNYVSSLGLASSLKDLGIAPSIIPGWLEEVNAERFSNNPVPFDAARLTSLIQTTLF